MNIRKLAIILGMALLAAVLTLPLHRVLAQGNDDQRPASGDPCQSSAPNPIDFQMLPSQGPAGSSFIIKGKPHDPRTVGPGSDVVFIWPESPNMQGVTASVGGDGSFMALISVPKAFAPGPHQLLYEEASPYTQCVAFTVTSPQQQATPLPGLSELAVLVRFLLLLFGALRGAVPGLH